VGILGVDYEYDQIYTRDDLTRTNKALIEYASAGGLITINLMPQNPWVNDESDLVCDRGTWDGPSSAQNPAGIKMVTSLDDLIDPLKKVHEAWMRKLDRVAAALQELRNAGVIVLWRPMQEMNGSWFWWGMKSHPKDPGPYVRVFRRMRDYFTKKKGLKNLIWVYSPNASLGTDNNSDWNRSVDWAYAGSAYVDIVAGTSYDDKLVIEDYKKHIAIGKPLGMAEYGPKTYGPLAKKGTLDTTQIIARIKKEYPRIAYFVCWHEYPGQVWSIVGNKNASLLMNDPSVITREDFSW
jgi:mannan endo-1,4-beta-mannosidase